MNLIIILLEIIFLMASVSYGTTGVWRHHLEQRVMRFETKFPDGKFGKTLCL